MDNRDGGRMPPNIRSGAPANKNIPPFRRSGAGRIARVMPRDAGVQSNMRSGTISMKNRDAIAWIVVLIVSFTPMALWLVMKPPIYRFNIFPLVFTSLGQLAGLVGMSMFSLNMILSARIKLLDKYFAGMNKQYNFHHKLGLYSFILLMLHPLLLAVFYGIGSVTFAALFLLPGYNWAKNFGIFALISMMAFLVVTLWVKFRYQVQRFFHQLLGVAFALGAVHIYLTSSDVSRYAPLRYYMFILMGLGVAAYFYRTLFGWLIVPRHMYEVFAVNNMRGGVTEIIMRPAGRAMRYYPGQFIFISFRSNVVSGEYHPFSISSTPASGTVSIFSKALGDYTNKLKSLEIGASAKIEGPYGRFIYRAATSKRQIWIGGGSGIAPILGMARDLALTGAKNHGFEVDIYYSARSAVDLAGLEEMEELASATKGLRVFPWAAEKNGFLTGEKVKELSGGLIAKELFICGPPPMMLGLKKQFLGMGVPKRRIHTEEFVLLR